MMRFLLLVSMALVIPPPVLPSVRDNPLRGRHVRLFLFPFPTAVNVKQNESGHVIEATGTDMYKIDWLSQYLGFTYSNEMFAEDYIDSKNVSLNRDTDWIVGAIILTNSRIKRFDMPYMMGTGSYTLLLPWPEPVAHFGAPAKPFKPEVWILLLISVAAVSAALFSIARWNKRNPSAGRDIRQFQSITNSAGYVATVILSQGATCFPKKLNIRIVAGCWCLVAFVMVNAYCCILTSIVSAPNRQLLVNSIYDLPSKPDVKVVVTKYHYIEVVLKNAKNGSLGHMGDVIRNDPSLLCSEESDCVKSVKSGSTVFPEMEDLLTDVVYQDWKQTGRCHLTMTKERFLFSMLTMIMPKNSDYTEYISLGIIKMWETGLIQYTHQKFVPKPKECINVPQTSADSPRLTLKQLSGPFAILLVGYGAAFFFFLCELIVKFYQSNAQMMNQ